MTTKRKAELQRKLSMSAVPRPPADLSDRIKADIPQYLQTEADRARFSGSVAFSMRVAASILLLITTAFVTLRLLEPTETQTASFAPKPKLVHAITRSQTAPAAVAPEPQRAGEEVRLDITQETDVPSESTPAAPRMVFAPQLAESNGDSTGVAGGVVGSDDERKKDEARANMLADAASNSAAGAEIGALERRQAIASSITEAETPVEPAREEAPVQTAESLEPAAKALARDRAPARTRSAPRAASPAPAVMPAPPPAAITVPSSTSSLMSEAYADELSLKQKSEVFGISVDPNVFLGVKAALQKGNRPSTGSVNVAALVNYFAGPPARARRGVTLEVEASPAPVEAEGDHAVLRFTVDTPRIEVAPRASTPPAATNARVEIEINAKAVASFHRIGGDEPITQESTLLHNLSVTALYELELRPHFKAKQHVATIRLRYRSVTDGKENVITRVVHGSDLAREWARASRRHRLASLGAVWSESLKSAATRADVARRAEELAKQEPEDKRARELAIAASATAGED